MTTTSIPDRTSRVPHFSFADTLEAQEAQLAENPLMLRFRESRRYFLKDPHRPLYHFVSPESLLNDPNGLSCWQGRWHLFYQGYPPEDGRQHWGHAVSDDLIHWRDLPYAIYPNPEECCFSGAALVEADRVIAMYHGTQAGDDGACPYFWPIGDRHILLHFSHMSGVEVFVNGRQCVAARVYPGRADSLGVSLRAQGSPAVLKRLDSWTMQSIYSA